MNDLEVYKGQFAVVIAGYEDQMDRLFAVNEGLASRFPNVVRTEDFTADELRQVFDLGMRERGGGFIVGEDLKNVEEDLFATMYASRGSDFGNGRTVTELIDRMKARAAERVRRTGEPPEKVVKPQHCRGRRRSCPRRRRAGIREREHPPL